MAAHISAYHVLILLSIVPFIFLLYTMLNLKRLEIPVNHPRVVVELIIFLALLILGLYLRSKGAS